MLSDKKFIENIENRLFQIGQMIDSVGIGSFTGEQPVTDTIAAEIYNISFKVATDSKLSTNNAKKVATCVMARYLKNPNIYLSIMNASPAVLNTAIDITMHSNPSGPASTVTSNIASALNATKTSTTLDNASALNATKTSTTLDNASALNATKTSTTLDNASALNATKTSTTLDNASALNATKTSTTLDNASALNATKTSTTLDNASALNATKTSTTQDESNNISLAVVSRVSQLCINFVNENKNSGVVVTDDILENLMEDNTPGHDYDESLYDLVKCLTLNNFTFTGWFQYYPSAFEYIKKYKNDVSDNSPTMKQIFQWNIPYANLYNIWVYKLWIFPKNMNYYFKWIHDNTLKDKSMNQSKLIQLLKDSNIRISDFVIFNSYYEIYDKNLLFNSKTEKELDQIFMFFVFLNEYTKNDIITVDSIIFISKKMNIPINLISEIITMFKIHVKECTDIQDLIWEQGDSYDEKYEKEIIHNAEHIDISKDTINKCIQFSRKSGKTLTDEIYDMLGGSRNYQLKYLKYKTKYLALKKKHIYIDFI